MEGSSVTLFAFSLVLVLTSMNCVVRTLAPAAKNNKTDVQHHTKIYTGLTDTFKLSWLLLRGLI